MLLVRSAPYYNNLGKFSFRTNLRHSSIAHRFLSINSFIADVRTGLKTVLVATQVKNITKNVILRILFGHHEKMLLYKNQPVLNIETMKIGKNGQLL